MPCDPRSSYALNSYFFFIYIGFEWFLAFTFCIQDFVFAQKNVFMFYYETICCDLVRPILRLARPCFNFAQLMLRLCATHVAILHDLVPTLRDPFCDFARPISSCVATLGDPIQSHNMSCGPRPGEECLNSFEDG